MADGLDNPPQDGLDDAIRENASGPAKATSDGTSMDQHTLADQIAADKYLASKAAMWMRNFGLRRARIIPPGATGI